MPKKKKKSFDCVEMKRRIQEKIYEETKDMTHEELVAYFHQRIQEGPFSAFLNQAGESPKKSNRNTENGL